MAISANGVNLASVILNATPAILALIKSNHAAANPGVPPPTDAEVLAELKSWAANTIAIDEAIKADQPADRSKSSGPASASELGVHAGSQGD